MGAQWIISLLLTGGVVYVYGSSCNLTDVENCFENLKHYKSPIFPLYGQNEDELNFTCGHIAMSYSCVRSYAESCQKTPECGDGCQDFIKELRVFLSTSKFENFTTDLCTENSPLRQTYLQNVGCLEVTADEYASCHNVSEKSLAYLSTIRDASVIDAECCYFTWYGQCFTNATRDTCGGNATIFISDAVGKLSSQGTNITCAARHIPCVEPPLPPEKDVNWHSQKMIDAVPWQPKSGIAYASGNSCNPRALISCFDVLQSHKQSPFLYIGKNETMLDRKCGRIGNAFICTKSNFEACQKSQKCTDECKSDIRNIREFLSNSRLENFTNDLCTKNSSLRKTYLENIDCIETNLNKYCACYNGFLPSPKDSDSSLGDYRTEEKCHFFTRYDRCFTNLSRSTCGQSASNLISYAVDKLWSQENKCIEMMVPCKETRLSPETDVHGEDENGLVKTHQHENRIGNGSNNETSNKTDNKISSDGKDQSSNTAKMQLRLTNVLTVSYCFLMVSNLFHK